MVWRVFVSPVGVTKNLLARPALVRMKRKQMVLALAIMDVSPPFFYRDHEDWNPQLLDNSITIAPSRSYWLFFFSPFHIVFSLTPFYLFFVTENLFPNVNVFHPNCFNKVDFLFELENESKRWTMCLQRWLPSCIPPTSSKFWQLLCQWRSDICEFDQVWLVLTNGWMAFRGPTLIHPSR